MMTHIFISYSKVNIHFARYLRKLLENEGFAVWMDETRLVPSQKWWPTIVQNIDSCAAFLVIMSPEAEGSDWVEREILRAERKEKLENKRLIFPILLSGEAWSRLAERHYEDMTTGEGATLTARLKEGLELLVPRNNSKLPPPQLPGELLPSEPLLPVPPTRHPPAQLSRWFFGMAVFVVVAIVLVIVSSINKPPLDTPTPDSTSPSTNVASAPTDSPTLTPTPLPGYPGGADITANSQWTPVSQKFNDVVDMVLVPKGCFQMGSTDGQSDEQPPNKQCFNQPFWIDRTEVTNAQFSSLNGVAANASRWTDPNHPRENITWFEARDYCELRGGRLPTEAESEYAARGPDALIYPWGNAFVADNVVYSDNSNGEAADVGSHPDGVSWVGALDMSGNVWEWVMSLYRPYPYKPNDGRNDDNIIGNILRVLRGGSWINDGSFMRAAIRVSGSPESFLKLVGVRCVLSYS